jgi:transposase
VNAKLSLAERIFTCEGCGLVIDRDVNAARNLLQLAVSGRGPTEPRGGATGNRWRWVVGFIMRTESQRSREDNPPWSEPGQSRSGRSRQ